jgi:D-arabinose 1-dehydrogenase-like Zn-dependent alcohol dehydrogenase
VLTLVAFDQAATGIRIHISGAGNPSQTLPEILTLLSERRLQVPIADVYPLSAIATALNDTRNGHTRGKRVLLPS